MTNEQVTEAIGRIKSLNILHASIDGTEERQNAFSSAIVMEWYAINMYIQYLEQRERKLVALENGGVDDWDWYDDCLAMLEEE